VDFPACTETVCADQKTTFFHFLFSVTPETPEIATEDWKKRAAESVSQYIQNNCAEGVLVQAFHGNILRLEVALQFSGQGRNGDIVRRYLKTVLKSSGFLGSVGCELNVESRLLGHNEDARHTIYESLLARTLPPSLGGWRLVLDRTRTGPSLSAGASTPGPAAGATVSGGSGAAVGGRAISGICAGRPGPAASDGAKFFSFTVTVKQAEPCGGDRSWIDKISGAVEKHVSRKSAEALLVQSVAGGNHPMIQQKCMIMYHHEKDDEMLS